MRGFMWGLAVLLLLGSVSTAARAQIRMVDASTVSVPLAIGAIAQLSFTLRNSSAAPASVDLVFGGVSYVSADWPLSAESGCPLPPATITLTAGAQVQCTYRLSRNSNAVSDVELGFAVQENGNTVQSRLFLVGDLTQLQVQTRILRFGAPGQPARASVEVRNVGPTSISSLAYGTCGEPVEVGVRAISGDCLQGAPVVCFSGGGAETSGFNMTGLAVGASKTCVVEWTGTGASSRFNLRLVELRKVIPAGADLLNTNAATQQISASGTPVATQLPLGSQGLRWLLLGTVLLIGVVNLRRPRV